MKISFCTTSMNRLFHIEQTYINNIKNSISYENVEFILLDYGSQDNIETWAKDNLKNFIEEGLVSFYQTKEPKFWVAAHAKNIAHKMASGDILINLDSDVYIPENFCDYIKSCFSKNIILSFDSKDMDNNDGCAGMIGARKEHFYSVNGYDENIYLGWGFDDLNYQFRCRMKNDLELLVCPKIIKCISHDNEIRNKNCQLKNIEATRLISKNITEDCALKQDYIANKFIEWGKAKLIKNFQALIDC